MPELPPFEDAHTVTFDCWQTLLAEAGPSHGHSARVRLVCEYTGVDPKDAAAALRDAWRTHQLSWHRRVAVTGRDMTLAALAALGASLDAPRTASLIDALESEILTHDVIAIHGAKETLARLAGRGVRRALICDTGYTPGRVVRQLLSRVGLLEYLEVTAFSDEVGVPKPHPRMFITALDGLGVGPSGAVHVGDLRRSDVAGARAHGMSTVRITVHNDDSTPGPASNAPVIGCGDAGCSPPCERPEADAIVANYAELSRLLGLTRT
jgi:putative hydrolase of the HAD superfamily